MKTVLFLLVSAMAFSAGAFGLDSHYGRVTSRGFQYHCAFHNDTGHALNMKYVVFHLEQRFGDNFGTDLQERIDKMVPAGDDVVASSEVSGPYDVSYCKFLAR